MVSWLDWLTDVQIYKEIPSSIVFFSVLTKYLEIQDQNLFNAFIILCSYPFPLTAGDDEIGIGYTLNYVLILSRFKVNEISIDNTIYER